jgi:Na+/H+ antiporter
MALFESLLTLAAVAIVLLQISRHLSIPYPAMLAMAGAVVAMLPSSASIAIDPKLALVLFIAPALLDAAYDLPPREMKRHWVPLIALAGFAVLLTTAAVAWAGVALAGMPLAAAIALGAIVAPPDAAAATAMLSRFKLPRRMVTVLKGESLLNDAVALLIFSAAVSTVMADESKASMITEIALAVPGGILVGLVLGKVYLWLAPRLAGTLGGTLFEFVTTFAAWIVADRLQLSAILSVVTFAITVARLAPEMQSARDRVHSYAVWESTVFLLNVLAFLLMGMQASAIVTRLGAGEIREAAIFAASVLAIVILVRVAWVMAYNRIAHAYAARKGKRGSPGLASGFVVAWCGMRGLVTLAIALGLPQSFPSRDLIVLTAFVVVLGTLVLQGLTLGPLISLLRIKPDESFERELSPARIALLDAAVASLGDRNDAPAQRVRAYYAEERRETVKGEYLHASSETGQLRMKAIAAQREKLNEMRRAETIDDDIFHTLEQELDWDELSATPADRLEMVQG